MNKQGHRTGHQMIEITDPADQDIFVEEVGSKIFAQLDCPDPL